MTNKRRLHALPALVARILLATRWFLAPFYLGLVCALLLYLWRFVNALVKTLFVPLGDDSELLLQVFHLLEYVTIANLIVMITLGGFSLLVSPLTEHQSSLNWLSQVDTTKLKVKLALSLVSVSSVYLLEGLINSSPVSHLVNRIVVHVTFVLSAVALTWVDRAMNHDSAK